MGGKLNRYPHEGKRTDDRLREDGSGTSSEAVAVRKKDERDGALLCRLLVTQHGGGREVGVCNHGARFIELFLGIQ